MKENPENPPSPKKARKNKKRKMPLPLKILLFPFFLLFGLLLLLGAWALFSALHRIAQSELIPAEFSAYVRTDNLFEAADPIADLKAADEFLSGPEFASLRPLLVAYRKWPLRYNRLVRAAANRRVDAAWYGGTDFVAVADMGFLSAATRLAPLFASKIPVLRYVREQDCAWFEFDAELKGEGGKAQVLTIYAAPVRNTIVAASSKEKILYALGRGRRDFDAAAESNKARLVNSSLSSPFRIAGDIDRLLEFSGMGKAQKEYVMRFVPENSLVSLNFGISDSDIAMDFEIPLREGTEDALPESRRPAVTNLMGDSTQYYTLLGLNDLAGIKELAVPLMPAEQNFDELWGRAQSACSFMFGLSVEDLVFSWTGREVAVLGLEGRPDPVFAVQVSNEKQRKYVFDQVISSIIIRENDSLILDGVRIPRLEVPGFFDAVLKFFGIDLVRPYYLVENGYIFFCVTPENLIAVHNAKNSGAHLVSSQNYKDISKKVDSTSLTVYYNLERSLPFFLRSSGAFTRILKMYNIGRADLEISKRKLHLKLGAVSRQAQSVRSAAGYPVRLKNPMRGRAYASGAAKSSAIFWIEGLADGRTELVSYDVISGREFRTDVPANTQLATAGAGTKGGSVWAASYPARTRDCVELCLFDDSLNLAPGFPVRIEGASALPCVVGRQVILPLSDGFCSVEAESNSVRKKKVQFEFGGQILARPTSLPSSGDAMAFYAKKLLGTAWLVRNFGSERQKAAPISLPGIGFGSPALFMQKKKALAAFITQAGVLSVWDEDGNRAENFPLKLEGVFYCNVAAADGMIYALSEDGVLHRVGMDGQVLSVRIPHLTAREGTLTLADFDGDGTQEIFASCDGDSLYGFSRNLELLAGFPVAGNGVPLFYDLNGNKRAECVIPSLGNTLGAWRLK